MNVRRWMTQPVITTSPDLPVALAYRKMLENDIRRLPVVDDEGRLVGILAERDARTVLGRGDLRADVTVDDSESPAVREIMTRTVFVAVPDESIVNAVRIMHNRKVSGLPVVENGVCIGMITVQDLLEVLLAALDRHLNEVTAEIIHDTLGAKVVREVKSAT